MSGNLKVKLPQANGDQTEPSVVGFVGECHVIDSTSSILEVSVSHSTFTMKKDADHKITYIEAS